MINEILDYLNPFSDQFHSWNDFKEFSFKDKVVIVVVSIFSTVLAIPIFRLMVGRFKKAEDAPIINKENIESVAQAIFQKDKPVSIKQVFDNPILKPVQNPIIEEKDKNNIKALKTNDDVVHSINQSDQHEIIKPNQDKKIDDSVNLDDSIEEEFIEEEDEDFSEDEIEESGGFLSDDEIEENETYEEDVKPTIKESSTKESSSAPKAISLRTKTCREILAEELKKQNKELVEVPDNGDCFYAAFAVGISQILGKKITYQELRQVTSKCIEDLDNENPNNWVKKALETAYSGIDSYDSYRHFVAEDTEESLKNKRYPIWGKETIDGVLLCRHYGVNLHVIEVGVIDDNPKKMETRDNYWIGLDNFYPRNETYNKTIDVALYPGHFLAILPSM